MPGGVMRARRAVAAKRGGTRGTRVNPDENEDDTTRDRGEGYESTSTIDTRAKILIPATRSLVRRLISDDSHHPLV